MLPVAAAPVAGGVRRESRRLPVWMRSAKVQSGAGLVGVFILLAFIGPLIAPYDPAATTGPPLAGPSAAHLFGTTNTGQDVFSEVLVGCRETLVIAFFAAAVGEGLAIVIGITAGYLEGILGEIVAMVINVFLVIPVLPLEIVLAGYLNGKGWVGIALIISVTAWPWGARILRAQSSSIRRRDYVEAARVAGEPGWRIVIFEVLPNVSALVVTGLLFHVLLAIVVQTSLAFLGVGDPATWSWGSILYWADNNSAFLLGAWWWYVPAGVCVALVGMGLALINLGLDEVINPKLRTGGVTAPRRGWWSRALGLSSVTAPGEASGDAA